MLLKPNALVYFRRNDLFIGGKHIAAVKLKFTPDVTNNLEVLKPDSFVNNCQTFFDIHDLKAKRVLVVLDQSIVFAKSFSVEDLDKDQLASLVSNFVAAMPFNEGQRACIQYRDGDSLHLFATNADLYGVLQEALRQTGIRKLIAITPAAAYKIDYSARPSEVIDQFLIDKDAGRYYDFSTCTPV
jgi:hypothetical protein